MYITPTKLRSERYWTDTLIQRHLGDPDSLSMNPHYRSGPPMRLYLLERVEQIETEIADELQKVKDNRARRKASARKASETKEQRAIQYVRDHFRCDLTAKNGAELEEQACEHWASHKLDWLESRNKWDGVDIPNPADVDPEALDRWIHNMIRHAYSNYDTLLGELSGRVGIWTAREIMHDEVKRWVRDFYRRTD